ncbi:MAG: mechanosensitive ion channel family protein [Burkholderiales bacterium]|nr:mechanosensitive ion channel family protein [Burkholderiales bacterium]
MSDWASAFWRAETPYLLGATLLLALLLYRCLPGGRATLRHTLAFFALMLVLQALGAVFALRQQPAVARGLHEAALLGGGVVLIRLAGLAGFRVLLPALRLPTPGILEDIVVIGAYLLWGMVRLSWAGVELSSLVATSAVITAVIAFAMQDTLGNILGGLALQLDDSLEIGDWVRQGEVSGRVVEIHWRYTAVLTRSGERVVIPNAQLMKGQFTVIGDPLSGPVAWRRSIGFNIDYAVPPSQVIAAAERALADAEIANVSRERPCSCVLLAFEPGSAHYALRYWLTDPEHDDATDSAVRAHLLATVQRNGWRLAVPDQSVHLVQEGQAHREAVWQRELQRRLKALAGIELFASLDEAERQQLAERLVHAPFARGDVMTRQGAAAHWLYIIANGEADVFWEAPGGERQHLTRLPAGSIFGEMGLMTGAPRSATVVAATDVECYRLDKAGFEGILHARQAIAEHMAHILAQRQQQNEAMKDAFRKAHGAGEPAAHHAAILQHIREFFGLH